VGSQNEELTASRTITLKISDWARLEEIRQHRGIVHAADAITYAIRAESSLIRDKQTRDNAYVVQKSKIAA